MRHLFEFLGVCALGVMPLVGCGDTNVTVYCGTDGSGGSGGTDLITPNFPCSEQGIRDAIAEGGGPHAFDCDGLTTVTTEAEIAIDNNVILDGLGTLIVDGNESHPVFSVQEGVIAELRRFTITGGATIPDVEEGGGIRNHGTLTVTDSTVSGNTAEQGAGILNFGTVALTSSTVSGNTSRTWGGGITNWARATLTITTSTVSGNTATGENPSGGGGILNSGTATITNSTVSGNTADRGGSAISTFEESLTLVNTLIDGNCLIDPPEEFPGELVSEGGNLESPGDTCGFDQPGDQANVSADNLKLGPLADNGGPTMTHALGAGSAAIDAIPEADCGVTTDQRGLPRPEPGGTMCDVGAFEVQP